MENLPSPKDVFGYFKYWQRKVDPVIAQYLKTERNSSYADTEYGSEVVDDIIDLTLRGGKRQRVAFVAATFGLLNGEFNDQSVQAIADAAAAVEILQTQLLIHDDVIDRAPTRRMEMTIHEKFKQKADHNNYHYDKERYGDSVGLLAGDLTAYFACYPVLGSDNIPLDSRVKILDILLRSGIDTFYGQLLDLLRDARGSTTEEEILDLAFTKAGRSSGEAPMHIGAVLASYDDESTFRKLSRYVVPVSIAAQLQDDILGIFGEESKLGKSVLSDLAQGKQTLLVLHAMENANDRQRITLNNLVGKKDITFQELEVVRDIMTSTGTIAYVKNKAQSYASDGQAVIKDEWDKNWSQEEKVFFWSVAEAAINREY